HALLRRGQNERSLEPLVERDMAALEHRADLNRELLAARFALVVALAALHGAGSLQSAAVAASPTASPDQRLKPRAGLAGVLEDGVVQGIALGHGHLIGQAK